MNWKGICIHHSAGPDTIAKDWDGIRRYHLSKGWRDIGYHFGIEWVGGLYMTYAGRSLNMAGAHCPAVNRTHIGVCIVGNFEKGVPHPFAIQALAALCLKLCKDHKISPTEIKCHRDFSNTLCPGKNMPMKYIVDLATHYLTTGA